MKKVKGNVLFGQKTEDLIESTNYSFSSSTKNVRGRFETPLPHLYVMMVVSEVAHNEEL
jgi:hypothetical protein